MRRLLVSCWWVLLNGLLINQQLLAETLDQAGYVQVQPNQGITLPLDHQAHFDFRNEWWYFTANLSDQQGRLFGVQWTLFRTQLAPGLRHTLFFAHSAVASQNSFVHSERFARRALGHANVIAQPWHAFIDQWSWLGQGKAPLPGTLNVKEKNFAYQLQLGSSPYVLQGDQGYSQKNQSGSVASYYYSAPFIPVSGQIHLADQSYQVTGQGWLDREWSTSLLSKGQQGWDWLSLQVHDNQALMLFRLRGQDSYQHGVWIEKTEIGTTEKTKLSTADYQWQVEKRVKVKGIELPLYWRLTIPSKQLNLQLIPLQEDQLIESQVGTYWEGAMRCKDQANCQGYLELTGYPQDSP